MSDEQKIAFPYKLKGTEQANNCPYCWGEHCVIFVNQDITLETQTNIVTILNTWECEDCARHWWQTMKIQLGEVLENKAELE